MHHTIGFIQDLAVIMALASLQRPSIDATGGVLAAEREGRRRLAGRAKAVVEEHRERIEDWEELCGKLGEAPAHVALAWLLHQDGVTAPIIGPRTREQLDSAQRALEIRLDAGTLTRLDEIFPGYKTAPEHYAW